MKKWFKSVFLFAIGGGLYILIELLARGRSHWTMGILGGLCFVLIGAINEYIPWNMPLLWQSLIGAGIITVLEFIAGMILNIWLELGIWDYSNMPLNLMGQICLFYSLLWILIALAAILLDDYIRWKFFKEEKPYYILI